MYLEEAGKDKYNLNNDQQLLCKKGKYRIIYPLKKPDGSKNWKNIFKVDWTYAILLIAILLVVYNASLNTQECEDLLNNPEELCGEYFELCSDIDSNIDYNKLYMPEDVVGQEDKGGGS